MSDVEKSLDEIIASKEEKSEKPKKSMYGRFLQGVQRKNASKLEPVSFYPPKKRDGGVTASRAEQTKFGEATHQTGAAAATSTKRVAKSTDGRRRKAAASTQSAGQASGKRKRRARSTRLGPGTGQSRKRSRERQTYYGIVSSFSRETGWGFVQSEELGWGDVFVHINECDTTVRTLRAGDEVQFELASTWDGSLSARLVYLVAQSGKTSSWSASSPRTNAGTNRQRKRRKVQSAAASPKSSPRYSAAPPSASAPPRPPSGKSVRVSNIPWTLPWQKLWQAFEAAGEILSVELDDERVGQAVITFHGREGARSAVQFDGGYLKGRQIRVQHEH